MNQEQDPRITLLRITNNTVDLNVVVANVVKFSIFEFIGNTTS